MLACATLGFLTGASAAGQSGPPSRSDRARFGEAGSADTRRVDFSYQIRPLLSDRCFRCHGPDAAKRKAKLRLDTREGAFKEIDDGWAIVKPGDPDKSELIRRIYTDDEDDVMPPPESHLTLSEAEKALLEAVGRRGRRLPAALVAHAGPRGRACRRSVTGRAANPIDAFVRARLDTRRGLAPRAAGITRDPHPPSRVQPDRPAADARRDRRVPGRPIARRLRARRRSLPGLAGLRRAHGDGLARPRALRRHVRLSGRRRPRHVAVPRLGHPRVQPRTCPTISSSLWQLAGDLLPNATREQRIATAFNRLHRQTNEGGSIEEEFRTEYVVDRVNTFGTAMLGLTLECARCHDHKFDPITQRDYYSLFAFFNNIDESGLYSHFTNATPSPSLLLWPAAAENAARAGEGAHRRGRSQADGRSPATARRGRSSAWTRRARVDGRHVSRPAPIAHLEFNAVTGDDDAGQRARVSGRQAAGRARAGARRTRRGSNAALKFSGDNPVVHAGVRPFVRTDPFSLSLRLKPTEKQDRAVILHQSRAWSDAGSRGFELTLDHGRPFFGLIHFWPGNAIAVRARRALPLNEWSRLVVTYDGSSRAAGIRLYLDGAPLETDVVRDHLVQGHQLPARGRRSICGARIRSRSARAFATAGSRTG